MRHAVIMAGGAGVRLWPLSRKDRPKQLLRLFSGKSLLRESYERVSAMLPPERINVITGQTHLPGVAAELPELPADNLMGEPRGRDTANAVALAAAVLGRRDPEAVIGTFTADHIITPLERFRAAVEKAYQTAEQQPDALVTMGISPSRPDHNYGYVQRGESVGEGVYRVRRFTEKPDVATAKRYLESGEFYWNSGMFVWRASTILDQLERHLPASREAARRIAAVWQTAERQRELESLYPTLEKISIDFAVMERAEKVLVVEMDCAWIDVGSWPAVEAVLGADDAGNVSAADRVIHHGSRGNIVVSEEPHLIATIGVDDLVIIHSPDATLVCKKGEVQSIKEVVERVRQGHGEAYT